jgi:hypothetical protein
VSADAPGRRTRVRRGEGEVTQWPRGLAEYVPSGVAERPPDPDEDRILNRIALAGRLIAVLRSRGTDVDREVEALRAAEATFRGGDRAEATRLLDALLGALDRAGETGPRRS